MTAKEAIRLLKCMTSMCEFKDAYGEYIDADPYYDAVDMAISALGKDTNVHSKDIVYRQDVEDMLQNALPSRGMWEIEGDVVKNTICETVTDLMMDLAKLPSALESQDGDTISRQAVLDIAFKYCPDDDGVCSEAGSDLRNMLDEIENLPPAQPERTCVNCGRTANNGGWYADGRTRCPIEEHYALPKDGFCHLWEKRNVTDDDYPERMKE